MQNDVSARMRNAKSGTGEFGQNHSQNAFGFSEDRENKRNENLAKQAESEQKNILELQAALQKKQDEKNAMILDSANDGEVRQKAETYTKKKAELEDMQEKAVAYQKAKTEYSAAVFHESETRSSFDREKQKADEQKQFLEKKVAILNESGCVDIEKAHCKFLQDAIEAKEQLEVHEALYVDIAARRDCELAKSRYAIENKQAEMDAIGYDAAALAVLQNEWQSYRIPLLISILQERMLHLCTQRIRKSSVWKSHFRSTSTHCRYRNSRQRFLAKQELPDLSFIIRYQCFLHTEFKEEMTL